MMGPVKFGFTAGQIIAERRTTKSDIDLIRSWTFTQNLPKLTDEQIILFLISCCNDQEATKKTIKAFYSVRKRNAELFSERRLLRGDLQKQLDTLNFCLFPARTDDGCAVIYTGLHNANYSNYDMAPALTLLLMTLEAAFYDHPPNGLIIIYDMKEASLGHMTRLRLKLIPPYCRYLQECLPVRLKVVHLLNTVNFIDMLMALLKPFLSDRVKDVLHFHPPGADMELFSQQWLSKRCLPQEYGGELPPIRVLHEQTVQKLKAMEPYFEAEERQRLSKS